MTWRWTVSFSFRISMSWISTSIISSSMANIPGLVAASGQFLQKSILVDTKVKALYDKVQDAPKEFESQRCELESLQRIVATVRDDFSVQTTGVKTTIQKCTVASEK